MTKNVLLTGVGGQGTILAAKMLTIGLMEHGFDVKMSEIHGMSQRGGDVISQVRYAEKVLSPIIEKGSADMIVAFEKMEALRAMPYMKPTGTVVVNDYEIPSMTVSTGLESYAKDVIDEIKRSAEKTFVVDATRMARELGNSKATNVILLGTIIKIMSLEDIDWETIIRNNVKEKFVELNLKALRIGMDSVL